MQFYPLNIDPFYIDCSRYIKSKSSVNSIDSSSLNNGGKSHIKYMPQEEKNKNVSEKFEENSSKINYDVLLQSNLPLIKLQKIDKAYFDRNNFEGRIFDKKETKKAVQSSLKEMVVKQSDAQSNGYYIIFNQDNTSFADKALNKSNKLYTKVRKIYTSGLNKKSGTLVNMVF